MNTNYFISKALWRNSNRSNLERVGTVIALLSVSLSILTILISIAVLDGFKHEIRSRITGFVGDVTIVPFGEDPFFNKESILIDSSLLTSLDACGNVKEVVPYVYRSGIVTNGSEIEGVIFKGITPKDSASLEKMGIVCSKRLSAILDLNQGNKIRGYFIDESGVSVRLFKMTSMYDMQLKEIDKSMIFANIDEIRRLNGWEKGRVSGIEIRLKDASKLDETVSDISEIISNCHLVNRNDMGIIKATDIFGNLFDWLALLDLNVLVVLVLMIIVSGFNMISGLLILLFEKTSTIGLLKSLGMRNRDIYRIFMRRALTIAIRGLIIGNLLAFVMLFIQWQFKLITLDPSNYFVNSVPVYMSWGKLLITNIISLLGIAVFLFFPARIIAGIAPDKSLKIR